MFTTLFPLITNPTNNQDVVLDADFVYPVISILSFQLLILAYEDKGLSNVNNFTNSFTFSWKSQRLLSEPITTVKLESLPLTVMLASNLAGTKFPDPEAIKTSDPILTLDKSFDTAHVVL